MDGTSTASIKFEENEQALFARLFADINPMQNDSTASRRMQVWNSLQIECTPRFGNQKRSSKRLPLNSDNRIFPLKLKVDAEQSNWIAGAGDRMKFDHIGIVAETLKAGRSAMADSFEITGWTGEFCDTLNGVFVQFCLDSSGICYELVAPLGDQSPVKAALSARRNILNHVAYLVSDLSAESQRLRSAGGIPIGSPKPAVAYAGRRIQFFVVMPM